MVRWTANFWSSAASRAFSRSLCSSWRTWTVHARVDSVSMFACDRGCVWAHLFELMPKCLGLRLLSLDTLLPLALLVAVLSVFAHRHSVLLEGVAPLAVGTHLGTPQLRGVAAARAERGKSGQHAVQNAAEAGTRKTR